MKKAFLVIGVFLTAVFLISSTNAATLINVPNKFTPRYSYLQDDVDVSYKLALNGLKSGWEFGVFDFGGDPQEGIVLVKGGKDEDGASFIVDENNILTVTKENNVVGTLDLEDSPDFSFFMKDSNNNYYFCDNIYYSGGKLLNISSLGGGMYIFSYNKESGSVKGYDLQAAPIPASFLLMSFAGGLVLVAYNKKFNKIEEV